MRARAKRHDSGVHERKVCASVSFPGEQYEGLDKIVAEREIFLVWVVRDAIGGYLNSKWLLLPQGTDAEDAQQSSERA